MGYDIYHLNKWEENYYFNFNSTCCIVPVEKIAKEMRVNVWICGNMHPQCFTKWMNKISKIYSYNWSKTRSPWATLPTWVTLTLLLWYLIFLKKIFIPMKSSDPILWSQPNPKGSQHNRETRLQIKYEMQGIAISLYTKYESATLNNSDIA